MTECTECAIAQTEPYHCVYLAGCESCTLRHLADCPRDIRERYVEQLRLDADAKAAMQRAIVTEYHRRKALIDQVARRALGLAA